MFVPNPIVFELQVGARRSTHAYRKTAGRPLDARLFAGQNPELLHLPERAPAGNVDLSAWVDLGIQRGILLRFWTIDCRLASISPRQFDRPLPGEIGEITRGADRTQKTDRTKID